MLSDFQVERHVSGYQYCSSNPTTYYDPTGQEAEIVVNRAQGKLPGTVEIWTNDVELVVYTDKEWDKICNPLLLLYHRYRYFLSYLPVWQSDLRCSRYRQGSYCIHEDRNNLHLQAAYKDKFNFNQFSEAKSCISDSIDEAEREYTIKQRLEYALKGSFRTTAEQAARQDQAEGGRIVI